MLEHLFCVSATIDDNYRKPHYPKYKTRDVQIGVVTSLERAVEIIKANVKGEFGLTHVHHFTVREVLSDETYYWMPDSIQDGHMWKVPWQESRGYTFQAWRHSTTVT